MIVSPAGVLSDSVHTEMAPGGAAAVYWLLVELQGMEQVQLAGELSRHQRAASVGGSLIIMSRGPVWRWESGFPEAVHRKGNLNVLYTY